jgi:hypothetical protein
LDENERRLDTPRAILGPRDAIIRPNSPFSTSLSLVETKRSSLKRYFLSEVYRENSAIWRKWIWPKGCIEGE